MDVIVAGAGPTGLTLACALLQRGISVRVVDSAAGPASTSRALGIQSRAVEVLDRVGALGDLPERGIKALTMSLFAGGRPIVRVQVGRWLTDGDRPIVIISQAEIEAQLRRRFGELGGSIEWGTAVVDATADADGVTVTIDGPRQAVRAGWLVGCDGAHSAVRKIAGIDFPGSPIVERFLLADVHADLPVGRDGTTGWLHRDGIAGVFPLPGKDLWRVMADAPTEDGDVLSQLSQLLITRSGMTGVHIGAAEWTSVFRIQQRLATHYRRGRILLAGDAAHIHSPMGGQGLNTGIGDAENLAWKLVLVAKGLADQRLLDTYEAERRPVAKRVLAGTTALTKGGLSHNSIVKLLRDRVVLPLANLPAVQRIAVAQGSQLSLSYRHGPLAPRFGIPFGLQPGDRVPNLPCRRPDGTNTTLHQELAGRWALIAPNGDRPPAFDQLADELVTLTADRADMLLVRPDAHLAWSAKHPNRNLAALLDNVVDDQVAR